MYNPHIILVYMQEAIKRVQLSSKREGFPTIPSVKWEDLGGLDDVRKAFDRFLISFIKHPELNKVISLSQPPCLSVIRKCRKKQYRQLTIQLAVFE